MPTATHRDFPWSILITALWAAAHRAHRFRLSKIEKTSNSKLSLVNFPFEFFQAVFINRFVCDSSFTWYKKVGNSQNLNSRGDPALNNSSAFLHPPLSCEAMRRHPGMKLDKRPLVFVKLFPCKVLVLDNDQPALSFGFLWNLSLSVIFYKLAGMPQYFIEHKHTALLESMIPHRSENHLSGIFFSTETKCPVLDAIQYGVANYPDRSVGGVATYDCYSPFLLTPTGATRTCLENGTWSGEAPTCQGESYVERISTSCTCARGAPQSFRYIERIIGNAEAFPILCVRYIRWEREREREREKDGSDVTIVALKLAMSFALLLAKNVHLSIGDEFCAFPCQKICTSVSPLLIGAEFTLSVAKNVALFETVAFFALSNGVIDRGSKQQSKRSNFRLHRSSFSPKKSKKWIKLIPKTIGNRKKEIVREVALGE